MDDETARRLSELVHRCHREAGEDIQRGGELLADEIARLVQAGDLEMLAAVLERFTEGYPGTDRLS